MTEHRRYCPFGEWLWRAPGRRGHGFDLFATEVSPGVSVFQAQVDFLDSVLIGVRSAPTTTTSVPTSVP